MLEDKIRSLFFPRWDKQHNWKVTQRPAFRGNGCCDNVLKEIVINGSFDSSLDELMIHEISHAATHSYHGKKWQRRMEKAAIKADSIGREELATEIRKDYTAYSDPERCVTMSAGRIYDQVEDAVLDTGGKWSFEEIIEFIADDWGCKSEDLLKRYKRIRSVYNRSRKTAKGVK